MKGRKTEIMTLTLTPTTRLTTTRTLAVTITTKGLTMMIMTTIRRNWIILENFTVKKAKKKKEKTRDTVTMVTRVMR